MYSTYAVSENTGASHCLQFNLTPIGARAIFGVPMHELSERIVDFLDVMGREGDRLETQIAEAPDWESRFDILDRFLLRRIGEAQAVSGAVRHAWNRLHETGGMIPSRLLPASCNGAASIWQTGFTRTWGLLPRPLPG